MNLFFTALLFVLGAIVHSAVQPIYKNSTECFSQNDCARKCDIEIDFINKEDTCEEKFHRLFGCYGSCFYQKKCGDFHTDWPSLCKRLLELPGKPCAKEVNDEREGYDGECCNVMQKSCATLIYSCL